MKKSIGPLLFALSLFVILPGCASEEATVIETDASALEQLEQEMAADDAEMAKAMEEGMKETE